ncbi:four helix bundle protein [candidate division WOR-3 bacterium]|nr:four helix bundle protein [candidate division WOR-3 bacterium]MCK4330776.1 four helix bundle protein [candidate division WOR-3 bacterium]
MKTKRFEDVIVWQKSHVLVLEIYRMTKLFPQDERFGLISQMRRCAISVPANIAEGYRKRGIKDKLRFYNIAQGSLDELRYYLILSKDLGYVKDVSKYFNLQDEVTRLLSGYMKGII